MKLTVLQNMNMHWCFDIDDGLRLCQTALSRNAAKEEIELIVKAVNNFENMKAAIGDALSNQEQYGYLTEAVIKEMKQLLSQLSKD